ncbi:MAG: acylphosphatase [Deltaproteobacteria bacterium]|jgi:acylphosphatase|nr:acylphosphatase [Deltaproteobacteria bacterium]MBW1913489.1 acylphosphatase [Deltaproteobacteria bacterium]
MENVSVKLVIHGRVQGVWFRESTRKQAVELGVSGWVKNRVDGSVEALIEGPKDSIKKLIDWCHKGPPYAKVDQVDEIWVDWKGELDSFKVVF